MAKKDQAKQEESVKSEAPAALNPWAAGAEVPPAPPAEETATQPESPEQEPDAPVEGASPTPPEETNPPATAGDETGPLPGESVVVGADTVTVLVPHDYRLTIDYASGVHEIRAGVQEMPLAWAEHWFSVANGVTIYRKTEPLS